MRAVTYNEFKGGISLQEVPKPVPTSDGVLVEVKATGICRSDWWGWQGHDKGIRLPHVPGHEFAGVIAEVGADVKNWNVGDRVTAPFVCGCGSCLYCDSGDPQICEYQTQPGFTHWGSFSQFVEVKQADFNLVELPDSIDFITAASLGCRFGTAYRAVTDRAGLKANESLVVMGCGGVGLSAIMIASALGVEIVAVDVQDNKLKLAEKLGASHLINISEENFAPESLHILLDGGAHATMDALGRPELVELGLRSLRPKGVHVQVGLMEGENPTIPIDILTGKELSIVGSHGMQAAEYPRIFELISSGACNPRDMVTGIISLEQSPRVLAQLGGNPPIGIVVIDMEM